jgi:hypothetical protein
MSDILRDLLNYHRTREATDRQSVSAAEA